MTEQSAGNLKMIENLASFRGGEAQGYESSLAYLKGNVDALDGGQGLFAFDGDDFSTPDDGLNTIVDLSGRRWKRVNPVSTGDIWAVLAASSAPIPLTGTTSETTLATVTVPAGAMGENGAVRWKAIYSLTNNVNSKRIVTRFGGAGGDIYSDNAFTTSNSFTDEREIRNRSSASSQVGFSPVGDGSGEGAAVVTSLRNTANPQDILFRGQLGNAADTITLESYIVEIVRTIPPPPPLPPPPPIPPGTVTLTIEVETIAHLKELPAGGANAVLVRSYASLGDHGGGLFVWRSGNQSANVASDVFSGLWAAPNSDPTGAGGAWQRIWNGIDASISWFGPAGNGVTDDAPVINGAIIAVSFATSGFGGVIHFETKLYAIASPILLGDGSVSQYSTTNSFVLRGVGAPFPRLDSSGGPLEDNGTRFIWTGPASSAMCFVRGPCHGNCLQNIGLNCNDLADEGLVLISASRGEFPCITISDQNLVGLHLTTILAESIGPQTEGLGTEGNNFYNLRINGANSAAGNDCIRLDGYLGSLSNGRNCTRNNFYGTYLTVTRVGGTGINLGFSDQNVFHNTIMSGFNTPDGNQASIRYVGVETVPGGFEFPQNNIFTGHLDIGQQLPIVNSGGGVLGTGSSLGHMTFNDEQVPPAGSVAKYVDWVAVDRGNFPKGGFRAHGGLMIHERSLRNKLRNSRFVRATRGTSIVNPANGAYTLDDWRLVYDGSVSATISRISIGLGQLSIPYEPKYLCRIAISSSSGGTFVHFSTVIPGVELFEGRISCLAAWIAADGAYSLGGRWDQGFGTGGSPSPSVGASSPLQTAAGGMLFERLQFQLTPTSIAGKTLGSNGDDRLSVGFILPVNTGCTIDIVFPQFEAGSGPTAFEVRDPAVDEMLSARFLQLVGAGTNGGWASATQAGIGVQFPVKMRAAPTFSASGASAVIATPGDAVFTDSGVSTVGGGIATQTGGQVTIANGGTWSGTPTAFRPAILQNDIILASAEL